MLLKLLCHHSYMKCSSFRGDNGQFLLTDSQPTLFAGWHCWNYWTEGFIWTENSTDISHLKSRVSTELTDECVSFHASATKTLYVGFYYYNTAWLFKRGTTKPPFLFPARFGVTRVTRASPRRQPHKPNKRGGNTSRTEMQFLTLRITEGDRASE